MKSHTGRSTKVKWLQDNPWIIPITIIGLLTAMNFIESMLKREAFSPLSIIMGFISFFGFIIIAILIGMHFIKRAVSEDMQTVSNNMCYFSQRLKTFEDVISFILKEKGQFIRSTEEMMQHEFAQETKSVIVLSRALQTDIDHYREIYQNFSRGVEYTYIIPFKGKASEQFEQLKKLWGDLAKKEGKNIEEILAKYVRVYYVAPHSACATVIVHNPAELRNRRVYIKLPSDIPCPLVFEVPDDAEESIVEALLELKSIGGCSIVKVNKS